MAAEPDRPVSRAAVHRLLTIVRGEFELLHPRLSIGLVLSRAIPLLVGWRTRAVILRFSGVSVGSGAIVGGPITIAGRLGAKGLHLGAGSGVNVGCHFDVTDSIVIGSNASVAQEVLILTGSHVMRAADRRVGLLTSAPVRIEEGAWVGARAVILPGVTVGAGAVVAAGAVVTSDVAPNTLVGGVPARLIRSISTDDERGPD